MVKLDEMVVKSQGKGLYDGKQGRRMESERARPSPARAVFEKFSAVGAGSASGPTPRMSAAAAMMEMGVLKDGKLVVSLVVHYAT